MSGAKVIPKDSLLLPYQSAWVKDGARLKIAEKSRQVGWTWATAYGLVRRKGLKGARLDAWISSRDEIQARLFLEDCKAFASLLQTGADDLGERVIDDSGHSAFVLAMANGLRIHSMSSNPDAQAGKRGDRVLDEFALHPDPRKLYAIAYPGITWGGSLEIFSTHRGSANFFNQLISEVRHKGNPKGFSLHRVTLEDALAQGFLHRLQTKLPPDDPRQDMDEAAYFDFIRAGCPDEETFRQEYMCEPSDDASAFISYEMIDACRPREPGWQGLTGGVPVFMGVDVGLTHDKTVFWLAEKIAGRYVTRRLVAMQDVNFDEQERVFCELMDTCAVTRCCIDQNGIGRQMAWRMGKRYGHRVEGVNFTLKSKDDMAYKVKAALEDRTLTLADDARIAPDFRSVKKTTTAAGNVRFDAERTKDGHGDMFWACGLMLLAGADGGGPVAYALPGGNGADDPDGTGYRTRGAFN